MTPVSADRPLRWGILGCGHVAELLTNDLRLLPDHTLAAVASRTPGKAQDFAQRHGVRVALDRYEDLVARDDIDAVYVANTHDLHAATAHLAIDHGKAVLAEKPLTINLAQAEALVAHARARGVFLMEGMWTRCFPAYEAMAADVAAGVIGPLRVFQADFGVRFEWSPGHRLLDPERGGGSLLDLGIYPIAVAHHLFGGEPTAIQGLRRPTERGVDAQFTGLLGFANGGQALLSSAIDVRVIPQARLYGPGGSIVVEDFFRPTGYTVHPASGMPRRVGLRQEGRGFHFELAEVAACLRAGRTESLRCPLEDSLAVLRTMDTLRAAWGQRYPGE